MDIRNCIGDLLSEHDCVIIPGFGGFIGSYSSSRIDPVNHTFQPPSKQLLFNVNLRHNDGLLAQLITRESGCSYPEAIRIIDEFVADINQQLFDRESVHFAHVGRIYAGEEGNLLFEQHRTANLWPGSFGLQTFISPPIQRSSSFPQFHRKAPAKPNSQVPPRRNARRFMRWAAILAVPLGIAIIIGMLRLGVVQKQITSGREKLHTLLARFSDNSKNKKSEVKTQETSVLPVGEVVSSLIDDSTSGPDSTTGDVNNLTNEKEDAVTEQKARFAVIVGAFRQEDNARKLVSDLQAQGNEALVYDQSRTGLFRVALGTFTDQAEAMKLLDIARSGDFPGAWVLKNQ